MTARKKTKIMSLSPDWTACQENKLEKYTLKQWICDF